MWGLFVMSKPGLIIAVFLLLLFPVYGVDVTVVKSGAIKSAVDLSGFNCSGGEAAALFRKTLEDDLIRSGWFTIAGKGKGTISVLGSCSESGGSLGVECRVSAVAARDFLHKTFNEQKTMARRLAHTVADEIVLAVKGRRGIASTRIAMIGSRNGKKNLYLCDSDGGNLVQVTREGAICLAPAWCPDGRSLVYTSFHRGFPDVYMIDLAIKERRRIAAYPGLNAGADVSPDSENMTLTLSKDGNPDLYVMNLRTDRLTRLTRTRYAAEASPSWSPDGKQIVFVSDKSGSPQLYVMDRTGSEERRITVRGDENVAPDWGPDGRIAFSSKRQGRYQICVIDMTTRKEMQMTTEYADYEDPSWAPDGRHIVCSRTERYHSDLYVLDTMGDPAVRLTTIEGNWYFPAWSK